MKTIKNNDRSATIMNDLYVIFSVSCGGGNYNASYSKSGREYKTMNGALRAANRWVKTGK
tara:strand:+ start:2338 stop:2517 length:180 start_codon:yes stop_codon:yes gene_type:complete